MRDKLYEIADAVADTTDGARQAIAGAMTSAAEAIQSGAQSIADNSGEKKMAVSLKKGGKVSLKKIAPNMTNMRVGLGWKERATDGAKFDLDVSLFMLNARGKVVTDNHFIFYNNELSPCGSVHHLGDNTTGNDGGGDAEQVLVSLNDVPETVTKIAIVVTIDEWKKRQQNFGMVSDAYISVTDADTGEEVCRYDLSEDFSGETALIMAEVYRHNGEFKFGAVGQGYVGGLRPLAEGYGVDLEDE